MTTKTPVAKKPAFEKVVPITEPTLPSLDALKDRYAKIVASRMITNAECAREFEAAVARHLGVKHAIAVSSCTNGLMLALRALNLHGEAIVPAFTFHATAHAAAWQGLKPVFVDSDPETCNIDPKAVEAAITPKTSVIMAVHLFGNPANVEVLQDIAKKHKLRLVFDSAHGFGAARKGKPVGGFGDAESFSLSPTKLVTCGEGGIVSTNDDELAKKIRMGRNYGDPGNYDCEFSGLSARMSEFNALMGIESLKLLDKNVADRNRLMKLYKELLSEVPGIGFQKIDAADRSSCKDFSIHLDEKAFGMTRDELMDALTAENIMTKRYFYPPVHWQRAFAQFGQAKKSIPNAEKLALRSLSLPLFSHMAEETVKKICAKVSQIQKRA